MTGTKKTLTFYGIDGGSFADFKAGVFAALEELEMVSEGEKTGVVDDLGQISSWEVHGVQLKKSARPCLFRVWLADRSCVIFAASSLDQFESQLRRYMQSKDIGLLPMLLTAYQGLYVTGAKKVQIDDKVIFEREEWE